MINPVTGGIIFLIGGVGTVATFTAFKVAREVGPKIEPSDLLPMPPPAPPLPRFMFTKPGLLAELRR